MTVKRLSRSGPLGRGVHFGAVSAGSILLTQVLLAGLQVAGLAPAVANAAAVSLAAVPTFFVSRRWVWRVETREGRLRQGLFFWLVAIVGLVLSTTLVWLVVPEGSPVPFANAVSLASFGTVWIAKFLFLDTFVFPSERNPRGGGAVRGRPGPAGRT